MLPNLPSKLLAGAPPSKAEDHAIHFAPILEELAKIEPSEVFTRMKKSTEGLTEAEAAKRLEESGPNVVISERHRGWPWRLLTAVPNPLVILLVVLAEVSFATGDFRAGTVMALMVVLGVTLRSITVHHSTRRCESENQAPAKPIGSDARNSTPWTGRSRSSQSSRDRPGWKRPLAPVSPPPWSLKPLR